MKKILIFCLYCVIFTLIPAVSVLAKGGSDKTLKNKPFPALEETADDGKDEPSIVPEIPPADEGAFSNIPETAAVSQGGPFAIPESKNEPFPVPETSANDTAEYKGTERIDRYSPGGTEAGTTAAASAAESAAAAAAQSARAAESAAAAAQSAVVTVTESATVPSQPPPFQPPLGSPQLTPSGSRPPTSSQLPPQPPVRTVVPTVNIIMPPATAPPAYRSFINVIPGMPDPYCGGVYRVQLGAFSNTGLAQQCFNRLKSAGFTPYYEQYGSLLRVVIAGIKAVDMDEVIHRLEAAGFGDVWIREER